MKAKRKWVKYCLYAFTLLALLYIYTAWCICNYSKITFNIKSDVALVLGAGSSRGQISPVFRERVNHAIRLLRAGNVDYIILTGGIGENETISDSRAAMNYAVMQGIDSNRIFIEEESTITFFNILNSKKVMKLKGLKSALIVSDPYHMKRSMHMCGVIGIEALPSPTTSTMYKSRGTKLKFLLKEVYNYWAYLLVGRHRAI